MLEVSNLQFFKGYVHVNVDRYFINFQEKFKMNVFLSQLMTAPLHLWCDIS